MLISTSNQLNSYTVYAKSGLWMVETLTATSFLLLLLVDLLTQAQLAILVTAPAKHLCVGICSVNLFYLAISDLLFGLINCIC